MATGFYLAAILGAFSSFFVGCLWYAVLFWKIWQRDMQFSPQKIEGYIPV